jgi:hypothetical protein
MPLVKTTLAKIPLKKLDLPKYHYCLDFSCHNTIMHNLGPKSTQKDLYALTCSHTTAIVLGAKIQTATLQEH